MNPRPLKKNGKMETLFLLLNGEHDILGNMDLDLLYNLSLDFMIGWKNKTHHGKFGLSLLSP